MCRYFVILSLVVVMFSCQRQEVSPESLHAPFLQEATTWSDSLIFTMSVEEKIGQLLIYQPELQDSIQVSDLLRQATNNKFGGMILEDLTLTDYLSLRDSLQGRSKIPLFNATRQQVSLHNQFSDLTNLPKAASLSAIANDTLRNLVSEYYIDQLNYLGINLSFRPSVNINAVTSEHFDFDILESDRQEILRRSTDVLEKIQNEKILSIAGDFNELHYLENDTIGLLDSMLFRYFNLVHKGLSGILVDPEIFQIDTLSKLPPHFLKRYLNEHTEFKGLLMADWETERFRDLSYTGVDVFIVKDSFENRFATIRRLVEEGLFTQTDLNEKVRKVLQAKSWMGLDTIRPAVDHEMAQTILSEGFDDYKIRQMYEHSITLLQNPKDMLPYTDTYKKPFRIVQVGHEELEEFQKYFSKYTAFSSTHIEPDSNGQFEAMNFHRFGRSKIVITLDDLELSAKEDSAFIQSINDLGQSTEMAIVNFGSPLNLIHFDTTIALVQNYERNDLIESLSAQLLFGALQAKGTLPLAMGDRFPYRHGITDTEIIRMKYTVPEEVGIAAYKLVGIDAIAKNAIYDKAIPGCQVLVAKDGKIIYSKSFGKHDFARGKLVQNSDLYDLASITKVASTTMGMMKLYDEKKFRLSHRLQKYIDLDKSSKLKRISLQQLLTHTSGIQPNMPIASYIMYEDTTGTGCSGPFCKEKVLSYVTPIADSFYMDFKYQDTIWQAVYDLKPRRSKRYRYSDVNFNLLMKVIEESSEKQLDDYVYDSFYHPMNLDRLTYKPLERFKKRDIVPTTKEERFRNQLIHGYVHDESAALLGGVAGNAGLFGNTESMMPLFQMLLNDGTYGGKEYLSKETIALFTRKQSGSKRGLGFDRNTNRKHLSCSPKASAKTYGHTGFTGTCVWVDPETDLVFIFLSNRIHPDVRNRKLFRKKTRTRMHNVIYEALGSYPEKPSPIQKTDKIMEANIIQ